MNRFYKACAVVSLMLGAIGLLQLVRPMPAQAATGFHISGRNLLDANGNNFIIRGISHAHTWYPAQTGSFANIKAKGANTVRVVLSGGRWTKNTASDVANVINLCKANRLICVLENHDTTGYGEQSDAVTLDQAVTYWKEIQSALTGQEAYVLINIGNEPYGNNNTSEWITATKNAIAAMRAAGFQHTLMVDAPNWGQDWQFVMRDNAASIFNSDPNKNTILSIHMYGVFDTASEITSYLSTFVTAGLPLVIGEFGNMHSDGNPDEDTIMAQAQANGLGYMGWSWSGNGGGVEYLDMVTNFDPNQVTAWGTRLIDGANGLQQTSQESSVYGGPTPTPCTNCPTNTPTRTPTRTLTPSSTPTVDPNTIVRVQYRAADSSATTNQVKPHLNIINVGTSAIPLSELKVRYWFTIDGERPQQYHCDYAVIGCGNVSGTFTKLSPSADGADYYLEVSFSGGTLAASGQTGEIQNRFNKDNWTSYTQGNDYSFDGTKTAFADWTRVTLYRNGVKVWGSEPGGTGPTNTPTATPTWTPTPTKTSTPTITPTGSLPDLVITSIVFDGGTRVSCGPPPSDMGDRVYISNNGTANAGPFSLTLNGNRLTVNGLAAGQSTSVLFPILVMSASAVVDADNQVAESNETNNTFTASLPVPTPPPTCTPTPTPTQTSTPGAGGCAVTYTVNQWNTGFTADVKITNNGTTAINGWTLTWSFANGQQITGSWNAKVVQTGANVTASNPAGHWNGTIGANGGSVTFGFQATYSGTNARPTNFALNGAACTAN